MNTTDDRFASTGASDLTGTTIAFTDEDLAHVDTDWLSGYRIIRIGVMYDDYGQLVFWCLADVSDAETEEPSYRLYSFHANGQCQCVPCTDTRWTDEHGRRVFEIDMTEGRQRVHIGPRSDPRMYLILTGMQAFIAPLDPAPLSMFLYEDIMRLRQPTIRVSNALMTMLIDVLESFISPENWYADYGTEILGLIDIIERDAGTVQNDYRHLPAWWFVHLRQILALIDPQNVNRVPGTVLNARVIGPVRLLVTYMRRHATRPTQEVVPFDRSKAIKQ